MSYEFGAWQAERANARDAESALNQTNADIRYLNGVVRDQNARIAQLQGKLAVAEGNAAGRLAQFQALKTQHPDSPTLKDSGKRFADGSVKTRIRLIFEHAFDDTLRSLGIANPVPHRHD